MKISKMYHNLILFSDLIKPIINFNNSKIIIINNLFTISPIKIIKINLLLIITIIFYFNNKCINNNNITMIHKSINNLNNKEILFSVIMDF
jgi:hypothetical protein